MAHVTGKKRKKKEILLATCSMADIRKKNPRIAKLTLQVLRALSLLAGLADNLDGTTGEAADDMLRLVL